MSVAQEQAHEHVHDTDTYYLDQLCMIGITAAFAGICLAMYFFNPGMLSVLLNAQFHIYILLVGIVLSFIVLVRAAVLWKAAGAKPVACAHDHDHDHEHGAVDHHHDHAGCGHDHAHTHNCDHEHQHEHAHAQPGHDCGHDHSWAPWRYVVLLVPLMLFFLGLPNKEIPLRAADSMEMSSDPMLAGDVPPQDDDKDPALNVPFKTLEQLAFSAKTREEFENKKVHTFGQFVPYRDSKKVFYISRLRIQCCGADAVQLNIPVVCREDVSAFRIQDWTGVTGRVHFREQPSRPGVYQTVLVVSKSSDVTPSPPDSNPYIN